MSHTDTHTHTHANTHTVTHTHSLCWHSLPNSLQVLSKYLPSNDVKLPDSEHDAVGVLAEVLHVHLVLEQGLRFLCHQGQVIIFSEGKGVGVQRGH